MKFCEMAHLKYGVLQRDHNSPKGCVFIGLFDFETVKTI